MRSISAAVDAAHFANSTSSELVCAGVKRFTGGAGGMATGGAASSGAAVGGMGARGAAMD
jgi:hypothetical protein